MLGVCGLVILAAVSLSGASCGRLNEVISVQPSGLVETYSRYSKEFSSGTNLDKYSWSPKDGEDVFGKRDGDKRTNDVLWFGPRIGKRSRFPNYLC